VRRGRPRQRRCAQAGRRQVERTQQAGRQKRNGNPNPTNGGKRRWQAERRNGGNAGSNEETIQAVCGRRRQRVPKVLRTAVNGTERQEEERRQ